MSGIHEVAKASGVKVDVVAAVFETILSMVADGEKVRIKGFGTLQRKLFSGRTLKTPAVNGGKPIEYPDSYVLKFHQSALAKTRINVVAKKKAKGEKAEKQEKAARSNKPTQPPPAEAPKKAPASAKAPPAEAAKKAAKPPKSAKADKKPKLEPGQDQE